MNKKIVALAALLMISSLVIPVHALEINADGVGYFLAETNIGTLYDKVEVNAWYFDLDMTVAGESIDRTVFIPSTHGGPYNDRDYLKDKTSQILYSTTYDGLTTEALLKIIGTTHDYSGGSLVQTLASGLTTFVADVSKSAKEFDVATTGTGFSYTGYHDTSSTLRFLDVVQMEGSTLDFSGFGAGGSFGLTGVSSFNMAVDGTVAGNSFSAYPDRYSGIRGNIGYDAPPATGYTGTEFKILSGLFSLDIDNIPDSNSDTSTRERYTRLQDMFGFTIAPYVP